MDTRRLLSLASTGLLLTGCATLRGVVGLPVKPPVTAAGPAVATVAAVSTATAPTPMRRFATMAPIPDPPARRGGVERRPLRRMQDAPSLATNVHLISAERRSAIPPTRGRLAIAAANASARETSSSETFVGGMQVFSYEPGRVYEVWTAPLRVTTLTLAPAETIVSKAAGDTVRWQIGETTSGEGPTQRAHVMIKPLERGLETNLVLATNQRVYLVQLKSGPADAFNAAVSWDLGAALPPPVAGGSDVADVQAAALVAPAGPLDARFRIEPRHGHPAWTPTAVMTDGVRTFLTFPPTLGASEAPGLFVVGSDGGAQMVNYRQQDGLWVVDRVFDRAELRVGDKHPQVIRITREGGRS